MYIDFPNADQAYNLSRMVFDNSEATNPMNVSQEVQFSFGDDFFISPISRPMQKQHGNSISSAHDAQRRRRLDDLRPFIVTNGSCCGPAKMTPSMVLNGQVSVADRVDPDGFTLYPGGWCTGGTKPSSVKCHHATPIGGIQPCPDGTTCESRCKADPKCLAFAWQSSKCYLWPCFAMGVEHVPNPGAVCGNRSAAGPGPLPPPTPPSPTPGPPAPGPTECPGLGAPIANWAAATLEECASACDFTSGTAQVGCSTFEWSLYVNASVPNCAMYNGWPSYINSSEAASANSRVCANRTGGFYPAPAPPPSGYPGRAVQDVWIPAGKWMHWDSGTVFSGPRTVVMTAGLADIPAFVRNGAVVPLSSNATVHELAPDPLRLVVVAIGEARGSAVVYEDDGDSLLYKDGAFRVMNISHATSHGITTLEVEPRAAGDGYAGERSSRTLEINLRTGTAPARLPKSATVNGERLSAQDITVAPSCAGPTCAFFAEALVVRVRLETLAEATLIEIRM